MCTTLTQLNTHISILGMCGVILSSVYGLGAS